MMSKTSKRGKMGPCTQKAVISSQSSDLEYPILRGITIRLTGGESGDYVVEFWKKNLMLFTRSFKTPPWNSVKIQADLASQLQKSIPENDRLDQNVLKSKVQDYFSTIKETFEENSTEARVLFSPHVRQVLETTKSVDVYPGDQVEYVVEIEIGEEKGSLQFSAQELHDSSKIFSIKWLNAFPKRPLHVSKKEWMQIVESWAKKAVVHEREEMNEIEIIIERLQEHFSGWTITPAKQSLISMRSGWYEKDGLNETVWIPGAVILGFLREIGKEGSFAGRLAKELKRREILRTVSRAIRIEGPITGKPIVRKCWAFDPAFLCYSPDQSVADVNSRRGMP